MDIIIKSFNFIITLSLSSIIVFEEPYPGGFLLYMQL